MSTDVLHKHILLWRTSRVAGNFHDANATQLLLKATRCEKVLKQFRCFPRETMWKFRIVLWAIDLQWARPLDLPWWMRMLIAADLPWHTCICTLLFWHESCLFDGQCHFSVSSSPGSTSCLPLRSQRHIYLMSSMLTFYVKSHHKEYVWCEMCSRMTVEWSMKMFRSHFKCDLQMWLAYQQVWRIR